MSDLPEGEAQAVRAMEGWYDTALAESHKIAALRDENIDLERQLRQARDVACEYASRLAEIERLLRQWAEDGKGVLAALDVAQGAAVQIPLRVLAEWALPRHDWYSHSGVWFGPTADLHRGYSLGDAVDLQIEREEAAPAAEASPMTPCPHCGHRFWRGTGTCCPNCHQDAAAPAAETAT